MKGKLIYIIWGILATALIVVVFLIHPYVEEYQKTKKVNAQMQTIWSENRKKEKSERINFRTMQKINPDILAWLEIPGTTISYPVVRTKDNNYYLTHNIYRDYSQYGALFFDSRAYEDPMGERNLIIYGHNMGNYTDIMFSSLEDIYRNQSDTVSSYLYLYTEEKRYRYQFVCFREVSPTSTLFTTAFTGKKDFQSWMVNNALTNADVPKVHKILTLATCNSTGGQRWVVVFQQEK